MYNPTATYRIQFNNQFTFDQLDALLAYFSTLGVKTIYASPIFVATPESSHGYDGTDPNRINPEIGTLDQLRTLSQTLHQRGMGWLQDIVPNHMAYHIDNEWLTDVLEKGPRSCYARYFDTALASSFFRDRILAPFLPDSQAETIAQNAITLSYEKQRLVLTVSGDVLPLRPESYATVLQAAAPVPADNVRQLLAQLASINQLTDPAEYGSGWADFREQLAALVKTTEGNQLLQDGVASLTNDAAALEQLITEQHYRLCTEPESRRVMTYRRFFTVNGLICLNTSNETVFSHVHQLTGELVKEGVFQGLRVDHVDGLFDPAGYLVALRKLVGEDTYLVVEKILQADEALPTEWPIEGTSGYEFLATVNHLLTNADAESAFRDFYHTLIDSDTPLPARIRDRKAYFLAQYMGGELDNLHYYFLNLNLADKSTLNALTPGTLPLAIGELLTRCPVYRYYDNVMPLSSEEAGAMQTLIDDIRQAEPNLADAVDVLADALLIKPQSNNEDFSERALRFYQRLMQFSGPLMAKGVEDTLLYTYNSFVAHNEVGDSPSRFGLSKDAFHRIMQDRQQYWPLAQNTTSTHDTKRGEDVRARLTVLTDLVDEWLTEVTHWQCLNDDLKGDNAPDPNDEYFIYQNLLGAYPMPEQDEDDFPSRFHQYMEKALQESKRYSTGWLIEEAYHTGTQTFVKGLLDRQRPFWKRFSAFHQRIADFGIVNSLVQLLLKMTCPGVPDVYQGCESWHLSLVDPDNRRPVPFDQYQATLNNLLEREQAGDVTLWSELWQRRWNGAIKIWLTHKLLHERSKQTPLFAQGEYLPLSVEGTGQENVFAFARRQEGVCYVTVVPLHVAALCRVQNAEVLNLDWQDTRVTLPPDLALNWTNCLTGEKGVVTDGDIGVQQLFTQLPLALLRMD